MYVLAVFAWITWKCPAVVYCPSNDPRAMLGSLLLPRHQRGIAQKRSVGCYIHKCRSLEPPALSNTGITRLTTSFLEWLHPPSLRIHAGTWFSGLWNAGMLLKPCLPSMTVLPGRRLLCLSINSLSYLWSFSSSPTAVLGVRHTKVLSPDCSKHRHVLYVWWIKRMLPT